MSDHQALATHDAAKVIARAAMLDAQHVDAMSVPRLREIADDAGIHPHAVQQALDEHASQAASRETSVPAWVRLCLVGVPDRAAATRFYWLFVAGMVASPLGLVFLNSRARGMSLTLGVLALCMGASWSTSAAIRWLDRHGWERLR